MKNLFECVPNFSEGRNTDTIKEIANCFYSSQAKLLDYSMDADHNRSVFALVGEADHLKQALFDATKVALNKIDLNKQKGEHPRIGALDVVPFIPLDGASIDDAIALANDFSSLVSSKLNIPIYLYGQAATKPNRENLAHVRRGSFEGLSEKMQQEDWLPDYGVNKPHDTFGAMAVGVRPFLIAYNINLATDDIEVANIIASKVRESSGGFANVKALGIHLHSKNIVQVSMNLTDYTITPIKQVYDFVCQEANNLGVEVIESEIIGLPPISSLLAVATDYLKLNNFSSDRILEYCMWQGE